MFIDYWWFRTSNWSALIGKHDDVSGDIHMHNILSKIIWGLMPPLDDLFLHVCSKFISSHMYLPSVSEPHTVFSELLTVQVPFKGSSLGSVVEKLRGFITWSLKAHLPGQIPCWTVMNTIHIFFLALYLQKFGDWNIWASQDPHSATDRTIRTHSICWRLSQADQSWGMPVSPQGLDIWVISSEHLTKGLITSADKPQETAFQAMALRVATISSALSGLDYLVCTFCVCS